MKLLKQFITPFSKLTKVQKKLLIIIQIALFLLLWEVGSVPFLPKPATSVKGLFILITEMNLIAELWTSLVLCTKAMLYATIISALISYLSVIPVTRYITLLITKGRFLSLVGLSFFFTVLTADGESLKTSVLTFTITVFFTTSFISAISDIPETEYNHARTTGLSPWETLYEVVIFGRLSTLMIILGETFAMAFALLPTVENLSRSNGGIGIMLTNLNRTMSLEYIVPIQIFIVLIGLGLDYAISLITLFICPETKFDNKNK